MWADRCSPLNSVHLGPKRFRPVPFGLDELPQIDFVIVRYSYPPLAPLLIMPNTNNTHNVKEYYLIIIIIIY